MIPVFETGTVKVVNPLKGFGFITPMKGREVFFHASGCLVSLTVLTAGDMVTFRMVGEGKKKRAVGVELI